MKNFTFAATSSFRLFEPMEEARLSGKSKDYRTLTDSLSETVKSFYASERYRRVEVILWILRANLKEESKQLETVIMTSLDKKEFKKHHDYLISYNKLRTVERDIQSIVPHPPYVYENFCFPTLPGKKISVRVYTKFSQDGPKRMDNYIFPHEGTWSVVTPYPRFMGDALDVEFYAEDMLNRPSYLRPLYPEENLDYVFLDKELSPEAVLKNIIPLFPNVSHIYLI